MNPEQRRARRPRPPVSGPGADPVVSDDDALESLKWHIDRYDRLRVSTAGRASVVLSAGAILFTGDALLLTQILSNTTDWLTAWWRLAFTVVALSAALLVMASLLRAASVLVTPRNSRSTLPGGSELPTSLVFNGPDTIRHVKSFAEFRTLLGNQRRPDELRAAQVELWIGIHQHRYRYDHLRKSVRLLRHAAIVFVAVLALVMLVNAIQGF